MKFRKFLFGGALAFALAASLAFTPAKKPVILARWIYTDQFGHQTCQNAAYPLNEANCSPLNTGAACTVTPGALPPTPGYNASGSPCMFLYRQP